MVYDKTENHCSLMKLHSLFFQMFVDRQKLTVSMETLITANMQHRDLHTGLEDSQTGHRINCALKCVHGRVVKQKQCLPQMAKRQKSRGDKRLSWPDVAY